MSLERGSNSSKRNTKRGTHSSAMLSSHSQREEDTPYLPSQYGSDAPLLGSSANAMNGSKNISWGQAFQSFFRKTLRWVPGFPNSPDPRFLNHPIPSSSEVPFQSSPEFVTTRIRKNASVSQDFQKESSAGNQSFQEVLSEEYAEQYEESLEEEPLDSLSGTSSHGHIASDIAITLPSPVAKNPKAFFTSPPEPSMEQLHQNLQAQYPLPVSSRSHAGSASTRNSGGMSSVTMSELASQSRIQSNLLQEGRDVESRLKRIKAVSEAAIQSLQTAELESQKILASGWQGAQAMCDSAVEALQRSCDSVLEQLTQSMEAVNRSSSIVRRKRTLSVKNTAIEVKKQKTLFHKISTELQPLEALCVESYPELRPLLNDVVDAEGSLKEAAQRTEQFLIGMYSSMMDPNDPKVKGIIQQAQQQMAIVLEEHVGKVMLLISNLTNSGDSVSNLVNQAQGLRRIDSPKQPESTSKDPASKSSIRRAKAASKLR